MKVISVSSVSLSNFNQKFNKVLIVSFYIFDIDFLTMKQPKNGVAMNFAPRDAV